MKILAFVRALNARIHAVKPHNDNLRSGQYRDPKTFSPWIALLP